jgi:hypothetical protein
MGKDSGGDHSDDSIEQEKPGYRKMMSDRKKDRAMDSFKDMTLKGLEGNPFLRLKTKTKYFLSIDGVDGSEKEVTKEQFVRAERSAGFRPKHGLPQDEPATGGFGNGSIKGRIE